MIFYYFNRNDDLRIPEDARSWGCVKIPDTGRSLPVELAHGVRQERVQFPSPRPDSTRGIFIYCSKNGLNRVIVASSSVCITLILLHPLEKGIRRIIK